ncbi:hypothetical protein F2Q70_00019284 [Brassica cretica]|uniref:Uncharacterized protein n=1 Tax=Brassica cretica TaxID=69181 RepID=A0A8S9GKB6_BRACR|nr:hypothetical protein F2Q70_00019284 [Brassica cretica]
MLLLELLSLGSGLAKLATFPSYVDWSLLLCSSYFQKGDDYRVSCLFLVVSSLCLQCSLVLLGLGLPGSRFVIFWSSCSVWSGLHWLLMAGPGLSQPRFACPPLGVAFGTNRGSSVCSPAVLLL